MKKYFTSESVTEGHPDKLCDLISDSILDEYLKGDENSRVGCEVVAGKNTIFVTGEITSKCVVDIERVVRNTIKKIGYFGDNDIDYKRCKVIVNISKQSCDIALGVNKSLEERSGEKSSLGAGDQGMMFGFACDETENYMPICIELAHKLAKRLTYVRKNNIVEGLGPDGKVQVTAEYDDDKPVRIDTVVISSEHVPNIDLDDLKIKLIDNVIKKIIPSKLLVDTRFLINPTGKFTIGGPLGDSGLTGRKIIVDTYGGYARHGGGAFSGKDATKVDRSASYMARFLAKNIVANGYARKCEIQLSYAIGVANPISINVNTFNTGIIGEDEIIDKISNSFDLTPSGIIKFLDLKKPIYSRTTNYGHFGRDGFSWEKIIKF
ncbi:MAG: methionine adenosyltransferase [Bacilli bacterium]|nr:methionine adenosyltransferase [Bacilli bacterium]